MAFFQTFDGLNLYYTDEGQGVPILCLAGITRNSADFDDMAQHLTGVRLIRMDYRGRGQSQWADDFTTYNVLDEGRDALALLDHLGIDRAAIIGTSRGGLIAHFLAQTAKDRLLGVALNDIGPVLDMKGLEPIMDYLGRPPVWKTYAEAAAGLPAVSPGFVDVPADRWQAEAQRRYIETPNGLALRYDPRLRDATLAQSGAGTPPDLWPLFDALAGLPLCAIRGVGSDLLSPDTLAQMRARRPDMIVAEVPDRGHVPFLDELAALAALNEWIGNLL
jgi:pimeloyl-ACP methyl ester carboxylesterase